MMKCFMKSFRESPESACGANFTIVTMSHSLFAKEYMKSRGRLVGAVVFLGGLLYCLFRLQDAR